MRADEPLLTAEQRTLLLAVAREAICARLGRSRITLLPTADPVLNAPGAAFVTIRKGRSLRGCIGYVEAVKPLIEAVAHCAVSAAIGDPRFPPVGQIELADLSLEISVLSALRALHDVAEIEVGRHGLLVRRDARQGLLLPQVATEFGWDRDTFLAQTCFKAGLPVNAWQRGAEIWVFTVDHFTDDLPIATA